MTNAKEELLEILKDTNLTVKCASIEIDRQSWDSIETIINPITTIELSERYYHEDYESFLNKLDFEYDNGFGSQNLFGIIWFHENNIWLSRYEYDGSEWWKYNKCPLIPEHLKTK